MSKTSVKFTAYPFVKKNDGCWISKCILRDDQAQDWIHYNYTLPLELAQGRSRAELGAVYELAATAALVLPSGVPVHVTYRFSQEESIGAVAKDEALLERLEAASTTYSLELMEPVIKAVADMEADSDDQDFEN